MGHADAHLSRTSTIRAAGAVAAVLACSVPLAATLPPGRAGAGELQTLRARARSVAEEVTALERRIAELGRAAGSLEEQIAAVDRGIGVAELQLHRSEAARDAAQRRYAARAVEVYKAGPSGSLELLLAARSLSDLVALEKAAGAAAEDAADALDTALAAQRRADADQMRLIARKDRLLEARSELDSLRAELARELRTRRATVGELARRIDELERAARRRARAAAVERAEAVSESQASGALGRLLGGLGASAPARGIPGGFTATGVSFEGIASWYGPGFEGNPTASGQIFDPERFTAASKELPLGTWLYVERAGRGVVVLVNDRGPYVDGRILDLSRAAAQAIGITGVAWIEAEIILKA